MDLKEKKLSSKEIYKGKILDLYVDEVMCHLNRKVQFLSYVIILYSINNIH